MNRPEQLPPSRVIVTVALQVRGNGLMTSDDDREFDAGALALAIESHIANAEGVKDWTITMAAEHVRGVLQWESIDDDHGEWERV